MKRWIRRILLSCSIGLMLAAVGLTMRGVFVHDSYLSPSLAIYNSRFAMEVSDMGQPLIDIGLSTGFGSSSSTSFADWEMFMPNAGYVRGYLTYRRIRLPHWLSFIVGAVYPTLLWARHRRRKKDVGFPVHIGPTLNSNLHQ